MAASKRVLARIDADGAVAEIIQEHACLEDEWHPDFLKGCVEITDAKPRPEIGWVRRSNGVLAPPAPAELSPEQRLSAALAAGCQVRCKGSPELAATYDAAGPAWARMRDEVLYIASYGAFSGGLDELDWTARTGEVVFKSPDDFKRVARAVGDWVTVWNRYVAGKGAAPKAAVTI